MVIAKICLRDSSKQRWLSLGNICSSTNKKIMKHCTHTFKVLEKHHCDFHADPVRDDWVPTPKSLSSQGVNHLANMLACIVQLRLTGMPYKLTEFLMTYIWTWSANKRSISIAFSLWWSGYTSCRPCAWPHCWDKSSIVLAKLLIITSF